MRFDFLVIGGTGTQGRIASKDLIENEYSVMLSGRDKSRVEHFLKIYKNSGFAYLDLRDRKNILNVIKKSKADIVLNCAEGDYSIDILNSCIKAGVNYLDLGPDEEMTIEMFKLHNALKKKNIIALTGCGSIPGIVNVMAGYASKKFDIINKINAGFDWNSNMKQFVVPYSIDTIVDEFTSKANVVRNGKIEFVDPLTCVIDHKLIGLKKDKARCVMHQEVYTFYRAFKDKGIKEITSYAGFPDHSFNTIMKLIELGLCSNEDINVGGIKFRGIEYTIEALKKLKIPEGYKEKEDLWINMYGKKDGKNKVMRMVCTAGTLKGWEDATCNIDTGMPISIMAQMIKNKIIKEKGVHSPEFIVPHNDFFKELAKRKMYVYENGKMIN